MNKCGCRIIEGITFDEITDKYWACRLRPFSKGCLY